MTISIKDWEFNNRDELNKTFKKLVSLNSNNSNLYYTKFVRLCYNSSI